MTHNLKEKKTDAEGSFSTVIASRKRLTIKVPGSTTNLGPGFDTLGLALSVYSTFRFAVLDRDDRSLPLITVKGKAEGLLPTGTDNVVYQIMRDNWAGRLEILSRVRIEIETDIPLARGLGSSSTAVLSALYAAKTLSGPGNDAAWLDAAKTLSGPDAAKKPSRLTAAETMNRLQPDREIILSEAARIEGHPDNVAASLLGGFVVAAPRTSGRGAITERLAWPDDWSTIVVVPPYPLSTELARKALPKSVRMKDAVANVQRSSLLVAAVARRDDGALKEALDDRLHEPYRAPLVTELGELKKLLRHTPALGCVLSGAGSSVLIIVNRKEKEDIIARVKNWASRRAKPPEILDLNVDTEGLKAAYETSD